MVISALVSEVLETIYRKVARNQSYRVVVPNIRNPLNFIFHDL